MSFAFSEEQEALRRSARRFLDDHSSSRRVRAAMSTELGHDLEAWRRIGRELCWPALCIPEALGGAGGGHVELVAIMEEMGRALLCAPFFSTLCLGASALLCAGTEEQQRAHLPAIARGERTATLACAAAGGGWEPAGVQAMVGREGAGFCLSGAFAQVIDGQSADLLVVAARAPGTAGAAGISLFLVPGPAQGVSRGALPTLDRTRRLAEVTLDQVHLPAGALLGEEGDGWRHLERVLDLACVALSAEQVGGAQRCLDMALGHARERVQFGRPIGSFQAIRHRLADLLLAVESARSAAYYAGWAAAEEPAELPLCAPLAAACCAEAFLHCAAECIQLHGGLGFTWEHDAHLYFRRARASAALLGGPAWQRERLAQRIGL